MTSRHKTTWSFGLMASIVCVLLSAPTTAGADTSPASKSVGQGIRVMLGLPEGARPNAVLRLARSDGSLVYFQSPDAEEVAKVREAARAAGLLGKQIFVDRGDFKSIHLADNLAGEIVLGRAAKKEVSRHLRQEVLRVLHPGGEVLGGDAAYKKPFPQGTDDWSHPYHGPDNNPQSTDRLARFPYLTQFLADPKFCPMPEVSVASGGRVYRAFGHIAHKANQNAMLNKLLCVNAYNGLVLWQRDLKEGFMIHRNTMIATPDTLYLADDQSCKLIDPRSGKVTDEIVIPGDLADGPVWKWMALSDGVLYALIGSGEAAIHTQPSNTAGLGHWPWGMWEGHGYQDPKTNFGFGRTLVAIDPATKKVLWSHREQEYLDSRGVCMSNGRIYLYSPEKFLACFNAKDGKPRWKTTDAKLLDAIGPNERAQHYVTGYSTTSYIKCNDKYIFFAGPQRSRLVVARADDGKLLWQKEHGNYQLVLRDDAIYAAGPQQTGMKLDYETGKVLARLPVRRACTRATGSIDSVFYRTPGGTVRIDVASSAAQHIAPMRPPCQDGVIISDGHLYWGPWMCGCQLSLYGHICLAPAGDFDYRPAADDSRLEAGEGDTASVKDLPVEPGDWPCYRGNNARSATTPISVGRPVRRRWSYRPKTEAMPTAPVTAGGMVFVADRAGVVRALSDEGQLRWEAHTGGAVYFPPAVADGRLFVGSADGRVYAFEATTGRRLWTFRVAPAERWIPVYGKLISTWPVAGGVVVHDGAVYAAAGIAHYDGTHVVALDAATGKIKWCNDSSGTLSENVNSGVSLQGTLSIQQGELRFLGGGVYQTARYDLQTGKCLNEPHEAVNSRFQTAFYPYYPTYAEYLSLHHGYPDGKTLVYNASYEGSRHGNLELLMPASAATDARPAPRPRVSDRRVAAPARRAVWRANPGRRYNSLIVAPDAVLAAGQTGPADAPKSFLTAFSVKDGSNLWQRTLPAPAVKGGTAVDHHGRIIVSIKDGRVLCLAAD